MPSGVTPNGVPLCGFGSDPAGQQRIQKEIVSSIAIENIARIKGLDCLLNTGCRAEAKLVTDSLGIYLRCSTMCQGLQGRALSSGQLLPKELVVCRLADYKLIDDTADVRSSQSAFVRDFRVVPKLVSDTLHVIRNQVGGTEQSRQRTIVNSSPSLAELRSYEFLPSLGRNLIEKHLRARLVKGAFGRKHFLHE